MFRAAPANPTGKREVGESPIAHLWGVPGVGLITLPPGSAKVSYLAVMQCLMQSGLCHSWGPGQLTEVHLGK